MRGDAGGNLSARRLRTPRVCRHGLPQLRDIWSISLAAWPPPTVPLGNFTTGSEEADEESNEGNKGYPVVFAVLGVDPIFPEDFPGSSPEHHVDDPDDEGAEECGTGEKK